MEDKIKQVVEKIINEWDPIELFPFSPKDEYKDEIASIVKLVKNTKNRNEVANGIQEIFLLFFGEPEFSDARYEESSLIAEKILEELEKV